MHTALLIIDIQNDYFPGGKHPLVEPLGAAKKAYSLLQCFRESGGRQVHIQHISTRPETTFFLPGDRGTDIHDAVAHFEDEPLVQKHYPNAFRETNLLDLLRGSEVDRVVVCRMMTHMCVDANARAAADLGFSVNVAADACATRDLAFEDVTIPADYVQRAFLAARKVYCEVLPAETILTRLAVENSQPKH
jgi:nicotinamidase-related amidase